MRVQIERDDTGSIHFLGPARRGQNDPGADHRAHRLTGRVHRVFGRAGRHQGNQAGDGRRRKGAASIGTRTIVFIDEIHRFNKAQQDAFLPHVEKGNIRLIGATTENPSFEVISALLSRCRVYVLNPLTEEQIVALMRRALEDAERGLGAIAADGGADEVLERIAAYSSGDARSAYNVLEVAATLAAWQPDGGRRGGASPMRIVKTRCRSACCSTTRPARSTTT